MPVVHRSRFFRLRCNARAFCLGVTGFTNPPISEALAFDHGEQFIGALNVTDLESGAAVVAEIEFGKVAVQMSFAAMLVNADHAALEYREHVLNRVGVEAPLHWDPQFEEKRREKWIDLRSRAHKRLADLIAGRLAGAYGLGAARTIGEYLRVSGLRIEGNPVPG